MVFSCRVADIAKNCFVWWHHTWAVREQPFVSGDDNINSSMDPRLRNRNVYRASHWSDAVPTSATLAQHRTSDLYSQVMCHERLSETSGQIVFEGVDKERWAAEWTPRSWERALGGDYQVVLGYTLDVRRSECESSSRRLYWPLQHWNWLV